MKQNKFDIVMDYIDANILQDVETIKKGIYTLIGYNSLTFGNCFSVLTGQTLFHYINERKMYFAAQSLKENIDRPIADIALEYGYSEQSAFSRAFKSFCKVTPLEIRKGNVTVSDNKYKLADICDNNQSTDDRITCIFKEFEETGDLSMPSWRYMHAMGEVSQTCIFDIDTCSAIFELAERLEIPFMWLLRSCENILIDIDSDPDYLSLKDQTAIECGIHSDEELEKICDFYNCKYYDLDEFMVKAYRDQLKIN